MEVQEGSLCFHFPSGDVLKNDDCSFYRNQFQTRCSKENCAVDILFADTETGWLIEVKDYRIHKRTKPLELADEVAIKVRDTLAGIVAAKANANEFDEKKFARKFLRKGKFRVVLHLEQPSAKGIWCTPINPANMMKKLSVRLKALDAHPLVVDRSSGNLKWSVRSK